MLQIKSAKPDKFTPRIEEKKDDYVRVEYQSPILGVSGTIFKMTNEIFQIENFLKTMNDY